jgi:hypothetical protein
MKGEKKVCPLRRWGVEHRIHKLFAGENHQEICATISLNLHVHLFDVIENRRVVANLLR